MSYTPATYLIQGKAGKEYIDLQVKHAPLIKRSETSPPVTPPITLPVIPPITPPVIPPITPPVTPPITSPDEVHSDGHSMDIIFDPQGANSDWVVKCVDPISKQEATILRGDKTLLRRLKISENQCDFNSGWSDTLRIYPNNADNSIIIKTVWDADKQGNGDPDKEYGIDGLGLINVFKLRTKNGTVNLMNTNTDAIRTDDNDLLNDGRWRSESPKSSYQNSLNWTVIYNIGTQARFEFLLNVKDMTELIFFEKDADAGMHPESVPADNGVSLHITWKDGSKITQDPEWTLLNQRKPEAFTQPLPQPKVNRVTNRLETNSYTGPSGDTINDEPGANSIRWYSIELKNPHPDHVKVVWEGYESASNAIAIAANAVIKPCDETDPECSQDDDEDPEDTCDPTMTTCPSPTPNPIDPNDPDDPGYDPTTPKCTESGILRACISSTPFPHPHPDSYLPTAGCQLPSANCPTITYHLTLTNTSQTTKLIDVNIGFDPPPFTTLADQISIYAIPAPGTGAYTGKGPQRFDLAASLSPLTRISRNITVTLDQNPLLTDYDISTKDRINAGALNNALVNLPELRHHVGNGAVRIEVTQCRMYDYDGGPFTCDTSCRTVEPGTKITFRDTLKNNGGAVAYDYKYFPRPVSSAFAYEPFSISIDEPIGGHPAENDGQQFPQNGITIDGPITPGGSRPVYYSYFVPEDILDGDPLTDEEKQNGRCYPKEDELFDPPLGGDFTPVTDEVDCSGDIPGEDPSDPTNRICVKPEENPILEATLEATPSTDTTVYQGSVITYTLKVRNQTKQPVSSTVVDQVVPPKTECTSIDQCAGQAATNLGELQNTGFLEYTYTVQVENDASGSGVTHPGHEIKYSGSSDETFTARSNSLTHTLIASPEPTGNFWHDIMLSRRVVLNSKNGDLRDDQGDLSVVTHRFHYDGNRKSNIRPYINNGVAAPHPYSQNYCQSPYTGPTSYFDAPFGSQTISYNSPASIQNRQLMTASEIVSGDLTFTVETDLPENRPELLNVSNPSYTHEDKFTYPIYAGKKIGTMTATDAFMKNGGDISDLVGAKGKLTKDNSVLSDQAIFETVVRAVSDGQANDEEHIGIVSTKNTFTFVENTWAYSHNGQYDSVRCSWTRTVCSGSGRGRRCRQVTTYADFQVPQYRWIPYPRPITLESTDRDYITVLSSVAWLQTKLGNLNFGTSFWNTGTALENPALSPGDPNWVDLNDKPISASMKWYTPPGEFQADLMILTPDTSAPLKSRMGQKLSPGGEHGFIPSPLYEGVQQLSRGEAYDRLKFPRDYYDDLLNRQVFGKVIRLNTAPEADVPHGMNRVGNTLYLSGTVTFAPDTIYHFKGGVVIGNASGTSPVNIAGGKSRLVVDGYVNIESNVRYNNKSGSGGNLAGIPSLRIHSLGNIIIAPHVTDIELLMLAEKEFHSGKSDRQLRILGDVIALQAFWERTPLNEEREGGEDLNKPSELIYEDFRKYLLTPPGDKKLPDTGHFWKMD